MTLPRRVDQQRCGEWFQRNRQRSQQWFELVAPDAYYARPIALRHPLVFYEGHVAAFNVNTLVKRGLARRGADEELETLFERGIDPPETSSAAPDAPSAAWPDRATVRAFADATDTLVREALECEESARNDNALLRNGLSIYTILEHEATHHETLLYMYQWLPYALKRCPEGYQPSAGGLPPRGAIARVPAGRATLGSDADEVPFGWDNEFPLHRVDVPAFEIDVYDVTNRDYLEFVEAGGYDTPEYWTPANWEWRQRERLEHPIFWVRRDGAWFWHGLFHEIPLPPAWPVYVSHAEASAFASWKGRRLPTEAEYHRAAFGTPEGRERRFPWGDEPGGPERGNFDLRSWDPVPVGSHPDGASAWGIYDLVGNGWEWTSTAFAGFPGFAPMPSYPQYSADFFDGEHFVMKGASPATPGELIRPSFRNWFRARYPYPFAAFRCVRL
jgi:ergothioneine biosynthesis protein EgtB